MAEAILDCNADYETIMHAVRSCATCLPSAQAPDFFNFSWLVACLAGVVIHQVKLQNSHKQTPPGCWKVLRPLRSAAENWGESLQKPIKGDSHSSTSSNCAVLDRSDLTQIQAMEYFGQRRDSPCFYSQHESFNHALWYAGWRLMSPNSGTLTSR